MTEARRPRVESPVSHQQKASILMIGDFFILSEKTPFLCAFIPKTTCIICIKIELTVKKFCNIIIITIISVRISSLIKYAR